MAMMQMNARIDDTLRAESASPKDGRHERRRARLSPALRSHLAKIGERDRAISFPTIAQIDAAIIFPS